MNSRALAIAALAGLACAAPIEASFHTFQVEQVFSNADGSVQYVVLRESAGVDGEHFWAGQVLRSTQPAGAPKQVTFASNLPSSATANRRVLVATTGFAALGVITPDYTMPARFVPTLGGTLNFASVDQISLPALPVDGATAVDRNGIAVPASPRNFAGATATMTPAAVTSVEYYHAGLDHYFNTSIASEIDVLDLGGIGGWTRTNLSFAVFPTAAAGGAGVTSVCRLIIPPSHGNSHFYGRSVQECTDALVKFPFMSEETPTAFFLRLPVVGVCPAGSIPIYRVFSNRLGDANHRYMTDRAVRAEMAAKGWLIEGEGDDAVMMCGPPPVAVGGGANPPAPPPPPPPPPPPCVPMPYGGCEP